MAVRVQTQADIIFGVMSGSVAVSHVRFQKAGLAPVVRELASRVQVGSGQRLRIPSGMFDVVYPVGQLTVPGADDDSAAANAHMRAMVDGYWEGETFQLDCLTDANTVVVDSGYSQQTYSNWDISVEAD